MFKQKSNFFIANFIYFCLLVLLIVIRIVAWLGLLNFMGDFGIYFLNAFLQVGLMFGIPVILYTLIKKQKVKQTFQNFNYKKVGASAIFTSVGIGICVFILTIFVSVIFNSIIRMFGYNPSTSSAETGEYTIWKFLLSLIWTAVFPAICEETAHRGLLLYGLRNLGMKKAILFSALLFGLMHFNIEQFFYATIIGILLGVMTISTGSIIPAMIVHFMNNAISVYLDFAGANNLFLGNVLTNFANLFANGFISALLLSFVIISIVFVVLLVLLYKLFKDTRVKQLQTITQDIAKNQIRNSLMEGIEGFEAENSNPEIEVENQIITPNKMLVKLSIPNDLFMYPTIQTEKPTRMEKLFFVGNLFLGIVVTVCTFIWGVI